MFVAGGEPRKWLGNGLGGERVGATDAESRFESGGQYGIYVLRWLMY